MFAHNTQIFKNGRWDKNLVDPKNGLYKKVDTKFKLVKNKLPAYLHFSSRVYRNIFDFNTIDKHIVAFDIGIYYLYLEKGFCYFCDRIMSVYNTNNKSFYYNKSVSQREEIDYLILHKLSEAFHYKYNKIFVQYLCNQRLFNNIEKICGQKKVWDLYMNIRKIYQSLYHRMPCLFNNIEKICRPKKCGVCI